MKTISMPEAGFSPQVVPTRGISFRLASVDFDQAIENLEILSGAISYNIANIVANSIIGLMAQVQPRVPYYAGGELGEASTGELRESGRAFLRLSTGTAPYATIIARGKIDGTIEVDLSKITPTKFKGGKCKFIGGNITYSHTNPSGQDIALWAHESLYAYEERPAKPAARTPGTGPKYLEIPWLQNKDMIVKSISDNIRRLPQSVKKGTKVIRRRRNKYEVDVVRLVFNSIVEEGYYGGMLLPRWVEGTGIY